MPAFDYKPPKHTGLTYEEAKAYQSAHVHPAHFNYYQEPVYIVDGKMQYLFDYTGKRYLDLFAGICTVGVGHCHPRINAVIRE